MASNESSNKKRNLLIAGAIGVPIIIYLAVAVFGIQTLFIDETVDETGPVFASQTAEESAPDSTASTVAPAPGQTETTTTTEAPAEVSVLANGSFIDRAHPSSGIASVLGDGSEQRFLRFEEFETDNGPDLFVYLTTANAEADDGDFGQEGEFVNLGSLKGNIGDQNYEIPADTDLEKFNTVVIWCRRFGVAFGASDLA